MGVLYRESNNIFPLNAVYYVRRYKYKHVFNHHKYHGMYGRKKEQNKQATAAVEWVEREREREWNEKSL